MFVERISVVGLSSASPGWIVRIALTWGLRPRLYARACIAGSYSNRFGNRRRTDPSPLPRQKESLPNKLIGSSSGTTAV
jgi:hypothetical protein